MSLINKVKRLQGLIFLVVTICLGIVVGHFSMPFLFRALPSDFKRTHLILSTLKSDEYKPDIILFGNSILMNGINSNIVSKKLNNKQVLNLSSTGQSLSESFLYYEMVPASTKTVVQFVTVEDLMGKSCFTKNTANNFLLYGYSLPHWTGEKIQRIIGAEPAKLLQKPSRDIYFESRWIVTNFINNSFRKLLRSDLALNHLETELYYPFTYNKKVDSSSLKILLAKQNPKASVEEFAIDKQKQAILFESAKYFKAKGINYKVVIAPIHPSLFNYSPLFFQSLTKNCEKLCSSEFEVINFGSMLTKDLFIDHCHPTPEGAVILSDSLSLKLKY